MKLPQRRCYAIAFAGLATLGITACSASEEDLEGDLREQFAELGISEEAANCAIDHLQDEQGLKLTDIAGNEDEYVAEIGQAGQACIAEDELANADQDAISENVDLAEDGPARTNFISSFASTSGMGEDVAECVLDGLLDEGFSSGEISTAGPEVITAVQEITPACAE